MLEEFRQFVARGNLVEIAVGLVMAVAFGAVVNSLVESVFTPVLGAIFGSSDFSTLTLGIWSDAEIRYGEFLNAAITFLTIATAVFLFVVKPYNALMARRSQAEPDAAAPPPEDVALLREIRDALRAD